MPQQIIAHGILRSNPIKINSIYIKSSSNFPFLGRKAVKLYALFARCYFERFSLKGLTDNMLFYGKLTAIILRVDIFT